MASFVILPKNLFGKEISNAASQGLDRSSSLRGSNSSDPGSRRLSLAAGGALKPAYKGQHFQMAPQTTNQREAITHRYSRENTFAVAQDFVALDVLDISLKRGDWVGVMKRQDPMGNQMRWYVDNGLAKGFVPAKFLSRNGALEALNEQAMSMANWSANSISNQASTSNYAASNQIKRSAPGPPLQPKGAHEVPQRPPARDLYQNLNDNITSAELINLTTPEENRPSSNNSNYVYSEFDPLSPDCSAISASAPPKSSAENSYEEIKNGSRPASGQDGPKYEDIDDGSHNTSTGSDTQQPEFFYAQYPFASSTGGFLPLKFGQVVLARQKCDLTGNKEWWLVEDRDGLKGYVPANYLFPYTGAPRGKT